MHRALIGPAVELQSFSQSGWLSTLHAQPPLASRGAFDPGKSVIGEVMEFVTGLARLLPVVPADRGDFRKF
jgi:hypothetical protein